MSSEPARSVSVSADPETKGPASPELSRISLDLFAGVRVALEARLGEAPITVEDLMALKTGAVVTLETGLADHIDLYLNNVLVARGEIVAVGGKYGVRIAELATRA
jgi:flagellar motor switch protein FliN/FliY